MSQIPSYLRTHKDQRLYYIAMRWAAENRVNIHAQAWYLPKVMSLLEDAGALDLSELEPLPKIQWRPPLMPQAPRRITRKPAMQEGLANLKRKLER